MNIERIHLNNFATYKNQELDFQQLGKTVAVFGSTGAGKTTFFIDALTVALYGRAYGQNDRESVKWALPPNQSCSMVTLDFTVGEKRYSVCRRIWRNRPAEAILKSVTEGSKPLAFGVKEVERMLDLIVGFDYQTFLNTVVVRQGDVAALISQEPRGRRDVFLRAFDVDFTRHKEKARMRREEVASAMIRLEEQLAELEEEVREKSQLEDRLINVLKEIRESEIERQRLSSSLATYQKELELKRTEYEHVRFELGHFELMEKHLKQLQDESLIKRKQLNFIEELVLDKSRILEEDKELQDSLERYKRAIRLINEMQTLLTVREQVFKLKRYHMAKVSMKNEIEASLKEIVEKEKSLSTLRLKLEERSEVYEKLTAELQRLQGLMEGIRKSKDSLDSAGDEATNCPVCGKALTREELQATRKHLQDELKALEADIEQLLPRIEALETERKELERKVREYEKTVAIKDKLVKELQEVNSAEEQLKQTEQEILETELKFASKEKECINLLGFIPSIEQAESTLHKLEARSKQTKEKLEHIARSEGQIHVLSTRVQEIEEECRLLIKELDRAQTLKLREARLCEDILKLEQHVEEFQSSLRLLENKLGGYRVSEIDLKERLAVIQQREETLTNVKKLHSQLSMRYQAFDILYREVFHEKGFPLALLRDFLQDVELYGQEYLQRFLPDKSIRIDVDEEGRITIEVVDGISVRELATYSGGETVLIGFAVRLGIARALAVRNVASAPRFLIIDEGFGPLSPDFRGELLSMLSELSQDYERIIVISHVEEIKENLLFASQIHVSKDTEGCSKLEVLS